MPVAMASPQSPLQTGPNLAEQVYAAVLDDICDGILEPGAHLVQEALAARFGVSRQPIQQAMALLKADGLVEEAGKRGFCVAELDLTWVGHYYEIRHAMDGLAARNAARRAKADPAIARAIGVAGRKICAAGARAVREGSVREQLQHDEAFHNLVYEASGNPLLANSAEAHWRFLRRVMGVALPRVKQPQDIWRQHRDILAAIEAGDAAGAEKLATRHVHQAETGLSGSLSGDDTVTGAAT